MFVSESFGTFRFMDQIKKKSAESQVYLKFFRKYLNTSLVVIGVASAIYYDYSLTQREKAERAENLLKTTEEQKN